MEQIPVVGGHLEGLATGTGEPVLFIHGSLMADTYECLRRYPALADRYRMISYRRRGFNGSVKHTAPLSIAEQAADAASVLDHFGIRKAHVVGHSYGAVTALQLALDQPARVHSLGLFEPDLAVSPRAEEFFAQVEPIIRRYTEGDGAGAAAAFLELVGGSADPAAFADTLPDGFFDQIVADIATFFEIELEALGAWTFGEAEARAVSQPALSVLGADSHGWFTDVDAWLQTTLHAESTTLSGATHFLQLMNPTDAAAALAGFLRRHPMS